MAYTKRAGMPFLAALSVLLGGMLLAPVWAVTWGPVTAKYDGTARARGSGDFTNQNPYANNRFKLEDLKRDGNTVYGKTTFWYLRGDWWYQDDTKATPEIGPGPRTETFNLRDQLAPDGRGARAESWVCVQLGFPVADSCSPHALATFYY